MCIHKDACTYIYVSVRMQRNTYVYMYLYVYIYTHILIYGYVSTHMYTCIYVHVYGCCFVSFPVKLEVVIETRFRGRIHAPNLHILLAAWYGFVSNSRL